VLGLAFHPDYADNGRFFVNLTIGGRTEIRGYQVSAGNPNVASTSFTQLLSYIQPQGNHNAGWMAFNPALTPETPQYLHIASGDGGGGGDTGTGHTSGMGNSQDTTGNLLGKILRIDVNGDDFPADASRNYAIPPTNPLVGISGDDEIWAYGLRNPWRNSFDRATGDLWIADVGQSTREEVNFQPAASAGGENYGWRVMEGTLCFSASDPLPCNDPSFTPPIHEYGHSNDSNGGFSITGGYVYRGPIPQLQGQYFFADYVTDNVWAFKYDGATKSEFARWNSRLFTDVGSPTSLSSFGEDNAGNLYLVSLNGEIFRMKNAVDILVGTGAEWKYLADGSNQATAWRAADFDDSAWPSGPSQLGYGDGDEATIVPCDPNPANGCEESPNLNDNFITTYFRHELAGSIDLSLVESLTLQVLRDDAAAVFLNGAEIYRSTNLPANAAFNTTATSTVGDENAFDLVMLDPSVLSPGLNVLAAEVHQASAGSSDISFDLRLSATMRSPTPGDTDFDGDVDRADAATLAAHYGLASGAMWINGDFNGDRAVDLADAVILQHHLTSGLAASSAAPVPEPTSLAIVFISAAGAAGMVRPRAAAIRRARQCDRM
jgi:hypothetical protein